MKKQLHRIVLIGFAIAILPAATGCETVHNLQSNDQSGAAATPAVTSNTNKPAPSTPDPDRSAAVSSNGEEPSDMVKEKPQVSPDKAYRVSKPTLMGATLGTPKEEVLNLFGKARNTFIMDEDPQAVTVYEYPDFSIGFNVFDRLEFIQVLSPDIDPGLSGLHLGDSIGEALNVLGKPDNRTDYVLAYKALNTILKLDVDPGSGTIKSIKLFPAS
ncbi:hypothetical protein [Paenibacillus lutrae]|uniref:Lipoprotein n=1 Tax=Paenibacillus lutrae TaxID=2078573 RepID=A0A7X3JXZ6_9BACL|nr:hypothetical protein [Paenibacillus lutrae]MVO98568.1 hypothetical protein [Paenibacillus lutrae]